MLKHLKKGSKLTLYSGLLIHLVGCNANQISMSVGMKKNDFIKTTQKDKICKPILNKIRKTTTNNYDIQILNFSKQIELQNEIRKRLCNLVPLIQHNPAFNQKLSEEAYNLSNTNRNTRKWLMPNIYNQPILKLLYTHAHLLDQNNLVARTIYHICIGYHIICERQASPKCLSDWRANHIDLMQALQTQCETVVQSEYLIVKSANVQKDASSVLSASKHVRAPIWYPPYIQDPDRVTHKRKREV
ncbi:MULTISPECIES: hypothetical protein [Candidatus Cardinium]|uniref:hypothetical protein n=1 Tax=Candidatus Cardinium TaxID=273135 RepID=UPI001FA966C7|nr:MULTISPECIES: hypothetical protein [Cardinium]